MKKISYLSIPFILSVGIMGCNGNQQAETNQTEPESKTAVTEEPVEESSTLPDDAPIVHVVITGEDEPFGFKDEYGNVQGIDVDVIKAVGEAQGFKTDFATEPRVNLLPSVGEGKYDVALAFLVANDEREEKYGLSQPYFYAPNGIMYKDDTLNINSIEDLTGLRVGVVTDASHERQLAEREDIGYQELGGEASSFLLYQALLKDKYDAIAYDSTILQYTMNSNKEHSVGLKIAPYSKEVNPKDAETVMVVQKGNDELLSKINQGIEDIQKNGEMDKIVKKWLGDEATNPLQNR